MLFNRLISLKSSEINRLYEQINLLNSLMTKLYKVVLIDMRYKLRFFSVKNSHTILENSIYESHNCSCRLKILVDLRGILAWLKLEEHVLDWLGRASIRFCCSCASIVFLVWFQVYKWDSYNVGDKIFVGFKNLCVCFIQKCNLMWFCKTFDNTRKLGSGCHGKLEVAMWLSEPV